MDSTSSYWQVELSIRVFHVLTLSHVHHEFGCQILFYFVLRCPCGVLSHRELLTRVLSLLQTDATHTFGLDLIHHVCTKRPTTIYFCSSNPSPRLRGRSGRSCGSFWRCFQQAREVRLTPTSFPLHLTNCHQGQRGQVHEGPRNGKE